MLRFWPKFLLVSTAFAPVLVTYAIVSFTKGENLQGFSLLASAVLAVVVCLLVMRAAIVKLPPNPVILKSIKPADKELIGFVLAYLLPLARGTSFEGVPLLIALAVFFLVVMTSNAYHTNPLLGLLGYHFYEVVIEEVGYVLVSRRNLHNTRSIKEVVSLTDYMLLDASK
jgi:hypothetical protein